MLNTHKGGTPPYLYLLERREKTMKLVNKTAHDQTEFLDFFNANDIEFVPSPEPFHPVVIQPYEDAQSVEQTAVEMIREVVPLDVDGILVGGLTSYMYYLIKHAFACNLRVFEVSTDRVRDVNGRFVFQPVYIREILP